MTHIKNARRARAGAEVGSTGRLNTTSCIPSGPKAQPLAGPRFECLVARVHTLGPRPFGEFLIEIAKATGEPALIARHLEEFARLDADILRALGGDKFPAMPLAVMP